MQVRATSQYATWLIESDNLAEINLKPGEDAYYRYRFSVLPVNNVRFLWDEGKPPEKILVGKPVDLALELKLVEGPSGPDIDEWRSILRESPSPLWPRLPTRLKTAENKAPVRGPRNVSGWIAQAQRQFRRHRLAGHVRGHRLDRGRARSRDLVPQIPDRPLPGVQRISVVHARPLLSGRPDSNRRQAR